MAVRSETRSGRPPGDGGRHRGRGLSGRPPRLIPDRCALRTKDDELSITWARVRRGVRKSPAGWSLGVRRGSTVGILLTNRPEFHLVDTAAYHLGATPFSIYPTLAPDQIDYVLANAEADVVVVEAAFAERDRRPPAPVADSRRSSSRWTGSGGDVRSLADLESMPGRPDLRLRIGLAGRRTGGRAHAHLHLGHHRPTQGRRAHPREPRAPPSTASTR